MSKIHTMLSLISTPRKMVLPLATYGLFNWMPDKQYLRFAYQVHMGNRLDLDNPKTFNEKIQWLKLYDRKQIYTTMVDKQAVKEYVEPLIGKEHIIPTIGLWDKPDEVELSELPDQFVLKCTHDSGSIVICKGKRNFDFYRAKKMLQKHLKKSTYWFGREWPYKNVVPRIIAEPYLEDDTVQELPDYKIHCFNGEPKVILVCKNRYSVGGLTEDFFDTKWEHLDVKRPGLMNAKGMIKCPLELETMLDKSRILAKGLPFIRVDFYIVNHHVFFGELTFFPTSGFQKFIPESFDKQMGDWIDLDSIRNHVTV